MNGYSPGRPSPPRAAGPGGRSIGGDGLRRDIMNNFGGAPLRVNPTNAKLPPSSALVDLKDPIQVHLLTETALTDSKQYRILSQEEVDGLKKQIQSLSLRVEQTRTNLAIQTKYRDAAVSMAKLYSQPEAGKRRSLMGSNRNSTGESLREAEAERQASEKRVDDLSNELRSLEQRLVESQRGLLEHTAGILQLTHKASKKPVNQIPAQLMNGIPGSPESLYTYSNGRNSLEVGDDSFDEDGLFQDLSNISPPRGKPRVAPLDIPSKAPSREQDTQLREEADKLREENAKLRAQVDALNSLREENSQLQAQTDTLSGEIDSLKKENAQHLQSVSDAERKLTTYNQTLRDVIINFNPAKNGGFSEPPSLVAEGPADPGATLGSQFEYLEAGLSTVRQEQELQGQSSSTLQDAEAAAAQASIALTQAEGRLEDVNQKMRDLLVGVDPSYPEVPDSGIDAQFEWLQNALTVVEEEMKKNASKSAVKKQDDEQAEVVLMGLWEIIQTGFASIQQQKADRRRTRMEQGRSDNDDDMSGDEAVDTSEPYSLSAFSTKVQWLYSQATSLKEQKSVLKRQIKQQRELNNKSDSQKDEELKTKQDQLDQLRSAQMRAEEEKALELTLKQDQLDQLRSLLERSEEEVAEAQEKLAKAQKEAEVATTTRMANESSSAKSQDEIRERDAKIASLEASSKEAQTTLASLNTNVQDMNSKLSKANEEVALLTTRLAGAEKAAVEKQQEAAAKDKEVKEKEEEIERFNMMIVELKTELTIAQAELDGAYGSRKERANQAAAVKSTVEVTQLKAEVDRLKEELASTLKELENITAETINAEREKFEVETKLDDALAVKSSLEGEISSLKDQLDAEVNNSRSKMSKLQEELDDARLKVTPGTGARGAGASMLSEQFRTTMREERKKFQEDMREEQAKRRRLEEELQKIRKTQGPGRSPLSPR
ncbi:involucrin repeat protein [Colletotrichum abscissum]|uniref:Involucrin repeat protein n=1 Tax=Colletotrichum abscissum TaxID=1671311 RepID=A0A9P9XJI0_9PEZI|nr:involucrin repeat protein [Colletotrichum abscissum]KAI3555367.1 involucrin repeat protein [Colletotrichum abscissum]KAK1490537.1 involucrin repeat protein [Colletotrichum abscissum]